MLYLSQLVNIQSRIVFAFQRTSLGLVSCKRLEELLEEKSRISDGPQARDILIKNPEIRFQGVFFRYERQGYLLKGMDLSFAKGVNALVGHSASGKTTILNLILRLYQPEAGTILIDGRSICDYRLRSLRSQIGIALQDPFLWNDTIENNLRYGAASARMSDLIEAAILTEADEFIRRLPAGYKSIIGENACKISEGQKQRLAIARAIVKKPKILILDEAMSSMDSESEERILARLKRSSEIASIILVSHRLSTVMNADRVYFLLSPDKVISGEAGRLLRENKSFYDLFSAQTKNCPPDKADFR
jgi:ABC-type multidrug transport system fused ATPase/permease subunit